MKTTGKVVVGAAGLLLAYEAYTLSNKDEDDTISEFFWSVMRRPLVPFALGGLVMHFVWQSQDVYDALATKELLQRREHQRRKKERRQSDDFTGAVPA